LVLGLGAIGYVGRGEGGGGGIREKAAARSVRSDEFATQNDNARSRIGKSCVGELHVSRAVVRTHGSVVGRSVRDFAEREMGMVEEWPDWGERVERECCGVQLTSRTR
jgi:hypothetical protein